MKKSFLYPIAIVLFFLFSCNPVYKSSSVQYSTYRIQSSEVHPSSFNTMMKPYSDSINKSMNDIIGENAVMLEKDLQKSTLGYFMTDAFRFMAKIKFNTEVDVAFINHGGIRLNELSPGKIARGKLFELMPFDNLLVLQQVKGRVLEQYLDSLASRDALNLSGISLKITGKKVHTIMVGDKPLEENKDYTIANSDYVISNSEVLKTLPMKNIGYLQRDALIDYVKEMTRQGRKIVVENINRVIYAD